MDVHSYWQKQEEGKPLYPDLLWNRPENKLHAGKILIIGGNTYGFQAPADAYGESLKAGIGIARTILPDTLAKTVGALFPDVEFATSTPSGSFAREAVGEIMNAAAWADGVLCAGDFGRNSETAIVLETLLEKHSGLVTLTRDAVDYFATTPQLLLDRQQTTLVVSFGQLQKLASHTTPAVVFTFDMNFLRLIENLHKLTMQHPGAIITKHHDTIFVAVNGQVITHKLTKDKEIWRLKTAAHACVWQLQNLTKTLEALASSLIES
jgi:ADP-dependent NAD(P)H-hydrate dehydratase / NAD(P)H-hydrate epimerase